MPTVAENFLATTLEAAQATTLKNITIQVEELNANLKTGYMAAFGEFVTRLTANLTTPDQVPAVPYSYVVAKSDGWAYPLKSTTPVCDQMPLPAVNTGTPGTPGVNPFATHSNSADAFIERLLLNRSETFDSLSGKSFLILRVK